MVSEQIFKPIVRGWLEKIKTGFDFKKTNFQDDAEEANRFFDGPYDWMYGGQFATASSSFQLGSEENQPKPTFRMTLNKVAEVVQLYGPSLYHRNPYREITPREHGEYPFDLFAPQGDPQQDPQAMMQMMQLQQMQQQMQTEQRVKDATAEVLAEILNFTPNELDLQQHSRDAIDEALIKGMGVLWHEKFRSPGSPYAFFGSFYDTVDNLVIDPDMESILHAKWIARRRVKPKWEVEDIFRLKPGTLTGSMESANMQATTSNPEFDFFRQRGDTNDLTVYWEVFSRMGLGHKMKRQFHKELAVTSKTLDQFGDNVYLAVTEEYPFPLNLPPERMKRKLDEVFMDLQWHTPYWADPTDPWPCSRLAFHKRPRKVWPMSHIKPALGQLKFMNWALSFVADKVKNTSRDFIAILKSAGEELKTSLLSGNDLTLLEIDSTGRKIDELVNFLQHPPFNKDILTVVEMMKHFFEQGVGLDELMYGMGGSKQIRSASEAQMRGDKLSVRPDDMATQVENWMTLATRKEALGIYWHLEADDVLPILGRERAQLFQQTVKQREVTEIVHELNYRIEAGSIRKPNRERDIQNANNAVQVWGPVFQTYFQMTGDPEPLNKLGEKWAKANDMPEDCFKLNPPPPPEPDQAAQQEAQMELQMKEQEHQQGMQHKEQSHQQKLQQMMLDSQVKLQTGDQTHVQDLDQDEEKHVQDLTQDQQTHLQEMMQARQEGNLDLLLKEKLGAAQVEATKAAAAAKPKPSNGSSGNGASNDK